MAKYNSLQQCTFEQINLFPSAPIQFLNHCYSKICTFYRKCILQRKYLERNTSYVLLIIAEARKPFVPFEFIYVRQNCLQSQNILNFFLFIATSNIYFWLDLCYSICSDLISFLFSKKKHVLLGHLSVNVFSVYRFTLNSLHGFGCLVCQLISVKIFGAKKNIFSTYFLCSFALALWIFFRHSSCNSSFTG